MIVPSHKENILQRQPLKTFPCSELLGTYLKLHTFYTCFIPSLASTCCVNNEKWQTLTCRDSSSSLVKSPRIARFHRLLTLGSMNSLPFGPLTVSFWRRSMLLFNSRCFSLHDTFIIGTIKIRMLKNLHVYEFETFTRKINEYFL